MFKLVKSMFRGVGRQQKRPEKATRPSSYVPLYTPGEGEIFPDFAKVATERPRFALRVQTVEVVPFYFQEHVLLFMPGRVVVCDSHGQQVNSFEAPGPILKAHAIDSGRLLCLAAETAQVLHWELGKWESCQGDFRGLAGLAWLDEQLVAYFLDGGSEAVSLVEQGSWSHTWFDDPTAGGRLESYALALKDGTTLTSSRLSPLSQLHWRAPHPLGPSQQPASDPKERILTVPFDPKARSAPQVGQPAQHWKRYPSHQQEIPGLTHAKARQGRVLGCFQDQQESVIIFWENAELTPLRCQVCSGEVRVDVSSCPCGERAPSSGVRPLGRTLLFSSSFAEQWEQYLQLREALQESESVPGVLSFGHLKTALKPIRSRYFQAGTFSEDGDWQAGEVLEDISCRAQIREGLCVHVRGREFHLLTTLKEGEVTVLVRGRFPEEVVAAEISVKNRRLYLGSKYGISEFDLAAEEQAKPQRYDECITYYDGADGGKRPLNGVKRMAISCCGGFLLVFSGSAHAYQISPLGLEYLGREDLLSHYGRRDAQGRVLGHRHGRQFFWSGELKAWIDVDSESVEVDIAASAKHSG